MPLTKIDAAVMKEAFLSGANNISNQKEFINELNVFPVPDGDTGTNMTLTIMSAVAEINAIEESSKEITIDNLSKAISGGSLRGARGNSGVILSQILRGFCKEIKGKKELDIEDITLGFAHAVETAYKAVMKPKEGTILTVARAMSERAAELLSTEDDIVEYMEQIVAAGDQALESTPDLLPVLKEAGVVDSGGQGLMEIIRGIMLSLKGCFVELENSQEEPKLARGAGLLEDIPGIRPKYNMGSGNDDISTADIKYTYCTEFIILLEKELSDEAVDGIKDFLLSIGDSLVCVADEDLVKIHIHTNHPGQAFEKGIEFGQLTRCKIDNMREEHSERVLIENDKRRMEEQDQAFKQIRLERNNNKESSSDDLELNSDDHKSEADFNSNTKEKATESIIIENTELNNGQAKKYGFVAVAAGDGIGEILCKTGVDIIIQGGQTMNPSTEDIMSAIERVNADTVYILPNNKNIIMASNQAAEAFENKKVYVVPSNTIPQGISSMLCYSEEVTAEDLFEAMKEACASVKTGEVTFSIRDTSVDGMQIQKNNIMGISDKGIDVVGTDINEVSKELVEKLVDEDAGMISLYYGEDISESDAQALGQFLQEKYDDLEVDVCKGGQPIYYYIISVE
ncbi:MAG: DAK2 domain-containing protein [Eubacterium sp.]|nr:DAK2 domain-containing protein [Eubacterium sp.]